MNDTIQITIISFIFFTLIALFTLNDRVQAAANQQDQFKVAYDLVKKSPTEVDSIKMYMAAAVALRSGNIKEAGLLYYAAQTRRRIDYFAYSRPDPSGPDAFLASLNSTLGQAINPAVLNNPSVLKSVVTKLKDYPIVPAKRFTPDWGIVIS